MLSISRFIMSFERAIMCQPRSFSSKQSVPVPPKQGFPAQPKHGVTIPPKPSVPAPPKRPLTAYMQFCSDCRNDIFKDIPGLGVVQQARILSEKWNTLPSEQRKHFEDIARKNTIDYGIKHKEFYENLNADQIRELTMLKEKKRVKLQTIRLKKSLKESGIPKFPSTAYSLFLQSKFKEKEKIASLGDFSKELGATWRNMSEEEKQVFKDKAKAEKDNYLLDMAIWRENVVIEGNEKLLSKLEKSNLRGRNVFSDLDPSKKSKTGLKVKKDVKSKADVK